MLQEVGFWAPPAERTKDGTSRSICSTESADAAADREYPDPTQLVNDQWFEQLTPQTLQNLLWFLTHGAYIESYELGYSVCRFDCALARRQPHVMGAVTLTDGTFVWPEGFVHYVVAHHVKPPDEFLDHFAAIFDSFWVRRRHQLQHQRVSKDSYTTATLDSNVPLLLWDPVDGKAISLPVEVELWIRSNTTMGARDMGGSATTSARSAFAKETSGASLWCDENQHENAACCGIWPWFHQMLMKSWLLGWTHYVRKQ